MIAPTISSGLRLRFVLAQEPTGAIVTHNPHKASRRSCSRLRLLCQRGGRLRASRGGAHQRGINGEVGGRQEAVARQTQRRRHGCELIFSRLIMRNLAGRCGRNGKFVGRDPEAREMRKLSSFTRHSLVFTKPWRYVMYRHGTRQTAEPDERTRQLQVMSLLLAPRDSERCHQGEPEGRGGVAGREIFPHR